ncbi:Chaperone protein DnaJ subfamily C [Spironucleus salmonicida]|uniref:Chaperone protein DnaJ n=1 Tax=Spironucleus salmonicida TaxID=348837 RepID=V6LGB2_9EUKA|nr:Chaperone protein DnaJ subfamily C [Spironucleus salmonicida]|eukprot:EST43333.1 Chaperone protein DnaJ [Spironucleus salmonicida]
MEDPTIDPETQLKYDYYKILNISEAEQDPSKIKKAYFKQAQVHHPDKNRENQEKATLLFRYIQEAYTTLSDPQERAHYNRNKNKILAPTPEVDEFFGVETFVNLEQLFHTQVDFYQAYNEAFKILSTEEVKSALTRLQEKMPADIKLKIEFRAKNQFPEFGDDNSTKSQITAFYTSWMYFKTAKTFSHADQYSIDGGDSRYRKIATNENEKFRKDARHRFEDKIRQLVQHIRRRDQRLERFEKLERDEKALRSKQIQEQLQVQKDTKKTQQQAFVIERAQLIANLKEKLKQKTITQSELLQLEQLTVSQRLPAEVLRTAEMMDSREIQTPKNKGGKAKIEHFCDDRELIQQGLGLDENEKLYCSVCNQRFVVVGEFKNHLSAKRHKKAVGDSKNGEEGLENPKNNKKENGSGGNKSSKKSKNTKNEMVVQDPEGSDCLNNTKKQSTEIPVNLQDLNEEERAVHQIELELLKIQQEDEEERARKGTKIQTKGKKTLKESEKSKQEDTLKNEKCSVCKQGFTSRTKLFEHIKASGHAARK